MQVYVNDGFDDLLFRKGSGLQSAFIIGLFTYYCSLNHNTSILVVEEPEAFLHPHARRAISRRLDEFVNLKRSLGKTNQVIVTTHSDEILHVGSVESVTLVRKQDCVTSTKTLVFESDLDKKEIRGILKSSASEMFFADMVILCEGAESFVIPRVADHHSNTIGYFDDNNISVISVEGKKSFASIVRALNKLGIPWSILTDFDFLDYTSERYLKALGYSGPLLNMVASLHQVMKSRVDGDIGRAFKSSSIDTVPAEAQSLTLDIIEHFKALGIWILSKRSFEAYLTVKGEGTLYKENERKIDSSKVAFVCRDDEENISEYFDLSEHIAMLMNFDLVGNLPSENQSLAGDIAIVSIA